MLNRNTFIDIMFEVYQLPMNATFDKDDYRIFTISKKIIGKNIHGVETSLFGGMANLDKS